MGDWFQISTSSIDFLTATIAVVFKNMLPITILILALLIGFVIFDHLSTFGLSRARREHQEALESFRKAYENRIKEVGEIEAPPFHEIEDFEEDEDF